MKDKEDVLKKFYDSFRNMEGHFHILEHRVPVEQQLQYFKYSGKVRRDLHEFFDDEYDEFEKDLGDPDMLITRKQAILSVLAVSKTVRAYRLIEHYVKNPDEDLVNWANMALMESRITLESEFLGEKQIYISTGLGGKGGSIRFYVLILSAMKKTLEEYQVEVIEKEFVYFLSKNNCEVERLTIGDKYVELVVLMPILTDIKKLLLDIIKECNLYGDFLSELFSVTNVKELTKEEIEQIVEKNEDNQASR
jgi:hypothetical protein